MYQFLHNDSIHFLLITPILLSTYFLKVEPSASSSEESTSFVHTLKYWILSWFKYVLETKQEYLLSKNEFNTYFESNKDKLNSETCITHIQKILDRLFKNENKLFHYNFVNQTTLGFIGDSIAEAANRQLKSGVRKIDRRMNVDVSALQQTKIVEAKKHQKDW